MAFARRRRSGKFKKLKHSFCKLADEAHAVDPRLYSHTFCPQPGREHTVCWARAMTELTDDQVAGICLHELGHYMAGPGDPEESEYDAEKAADVAVFLEFGVEMAYKGDNLIQSVDYRKLMRRK